MEALFSANPLLNCYVSNSNYTINLLHSVNGVDFFSILDGPSNGMELLTFFDDALQVERITVSRPMNCVARKMWGIHDAVRAHKARRHFWFSLTSIPSIPKRDL